MRTAWLHLLSRCSSCVSLHTLPSTLFNREPCCQRSRPSVFPIAPCELGDYSHSCPFNQNVRVALDYRLKITSPLVMNRPQLSRRVVDLAQSLRSPRRPCAKVLQHEYWHFNVRSCAKSMVINTSTLTDQRRMDRPKDNVFRSLDRSLITLLDVGSLESHVDTTSPISVMPWKM